MPSVSEPDFAERQGSAARDSKCGVRESPPSAALRKAKRRSIVVQTAGCSLCLVTAGCCSSPSGVGGIVAGKEWRVSSGWFFGVIAIGMFRALLDAAGGRLAFRAARAVFPAKRDKAVAALARRSPLDIERPASGFAASVLGEQAEAIVPYLPVSSRRG